MAGQAAAEGKQPTCLLCTQACADSISQWSIFMFYLQHHATVTEYLLHMAEHKIQTGLLPLWKSKNCARLLFQFQNSEPRPHCTETSDPPPTRRRCQDQTSAAS